VSDIRVLIVVDGIFNLSTTHPYQPPNPGDSPDGWFLLSFLITALRDSTSPTFFVDTANRGFSADGFLIPDNNNVPDPSATLKGPDPNNPTPFRFDDPSVNLLDYDEIWLFGDSGYDGGAPVGPPFTDPQSGQSGEPGRLTDSELAKITEFMQAGGGVFAVGDHDGLGAGMCGFIPRVRYMRKWFDASDESAGLPPLAERNWSIGSTGLVLPRRDTLQKGATDDENAPNSTGDPVFFFDDQSDDRPQPLNVLVATHPVVQGATGVLKVYPDHMHEGEVIAPAPHSPQLAQTYASDSTLSFAGPNFTEFPSTPIGTYQEPPIILAQVTAGATPHGTTVQPEDMACATPFGATENTCQTASLNVLAAYDGTRVNVGRIVTDSSFHHFMDLNLIGDPCSGVPAKVLGFKASPSGQAVLNELQAFYINLATWLAWIDRSLYFGLGKNNYGRNEVSDHLSPYVYQDAFYVFLEGFTPNVVGSSIPTLSGSFTNSIPGLVISGPSVTYDIGNSGANGNVPQRIRFAYSIEFAAESLNVFPGASDSSEASFTLNASISIGNNPYTSSAVEFFLLGGADPYFTNVNPAADNRSYLSQDLRVFTITPTANDQTPIVDSQSPVPPVSFVFQGGSPTTQDTAAAYAYIQGLITYLNQTYGYLNTDPNYTPPDTNTFDPLDTLLPNQNGALNGDSSVTPKNGSNIWNYNFAIARVRLQGPSGQANAASNVEVFFRMFTTQTFDTDFIDSPSAVTSADPNVTYPQSGTNPPTPLPGTDGTGAINGCSLPFFATANLDASPTDYAAAPAGVNNQTIAIPNGTYAWAFFGCFLNVNDATNEFGDPGSQYGQHPVQYWLAGSAHNCLVAQIAYDLAPIENVNGVIENPENSDKLAQRNLQVTTSGNPGFPSTHRVPQTIDVRPSPPPQSTDRRSILSYPDEIMIDWGDTPHGSVARIYWPEASAASILELAKQLYPVNSFSAADANTIQWKVTSPVTYIPIPYGDGGSLAGLLTIDLPATVRSGNEFNVLVRRITTRQLPTRKSSDDAARQASAPSAAVAGGQLVWRYVAGSFLAKISVQRESEILPADENLLAILKWRLSLIGPSNRWYPVLLRYISNLSGRINGMGGNASQIPPSSGGYQQPSPVPGKHAGEHCYTGKVIGIRYDRFGDFEGFTLLSKNGREHWFRGREHQVEELVRRAWIERTVISVFVEPHDPDWPASIILDRWK
jgi:hypothetical protein